MFDVKYRHGKASLTLAASLKARDLPLSLPFILQTNFQMSRKHFSYLFICLKAVEALPPEPILPTIRGARRPMDRPWIIIKTMNMVSVIGNLI